MTPTSMVQRYKAVQIKTCSPGELLLLLYEGLLRFLGEAACAMRAGDRARAGERIDRAHTILTELASCLTHAEAPELCDNLSGIYSYCMTQIVEANIHQDPSRLDAVIRILTPLYGAWIEAVRSSEPAKPARG